MTLPPIRLIGALSCVLLSGCAGFVSTPVAPLPANAQKQAAADGMYYYMPIAPIIVQVALDASKNKTVTIPTVSAYPDLSQPYLLSVPSNLVSENHAVLSVGINGLLESAGTTETSGVDTIVKSIASDLGAVTALTGAAPALAPAPPAPAAVDDCKASSTYSLVIDPRTLDPIAQLGPICGYNVTLTKLGAGSPLGSSGRANQYGSAQSGIFYKTEIPYMISVEATGVTTPQTFIAYSPNEAPVLFAPLQKTFFANNTTTLTLSDGILTKSDSDLGGELTGFVALPADAIGAYMSAVGNIFSAFKTNASDQTGAAVSNAQLQLCRSALAANPLQGVSAAQAAANYAAIKSACGD